MEIKEEWQRELEYAFEEMYDEDRSKFVVVSFLLNLVPSKGEAAAAASSQVQLVARPHVCS